MRIACLADVHGNLHALEAVLAHIEGARPDLVVNLGDLVSGPFDPGGSADRQMRMSCPTIAGNHERQVLKGATGASDVFARARLSEAQLRWMSGLPASLSLAGGEVFACHGSPAGGDLEYLLEDVSSGRARLASEATIAPRLGGIGDARLVLCGHTHVARVVTVGHVLVVNPGSVGMPAYRTSEPTPHVMEAGSPHARYAVLDRTDAGWTAALHAVPYDHEASAREAELNGGLETAHGVRTGWLPST